LEDWRVKMSEIIKILSGLNPIVLSILLIIAGILLIAICIFVYIVVIKQGRTIEILGIKIGTGKQDNSKATIPSDKNISCNYDAFISTPISGLQSDNEYHEIREDIVNLIKILKSHCGMKNIFYLGERITSTKGSGLPDVALKEVFQVIRESRYYIGVYPKKVATGAYVEAGFAFALNKNCVIFTTNMNDLPGIIRKAPGMLPHVKIYEYTDEEDLLSKVREYGIKIFNIQSIA